MSYPNKATPEFKFSKEMQSPLDVEVQTKILNVCWKPLFRSFKSSHQDVFLRKGVVKISSKFTWEHPCRSAISINLRSNFSEIALRHGRSPVNLLHIFRTPFSRNTSGWLLLVFSGTPNFLATFCWIDHFLSLSKTGISYTKLLTLCFHLNDMLLCWNKKR